MTTLKLIILAGLPGSGKSTLADGLSRHFSLPLLSVDPIEAAMWRGGLARDQTGIAAYEVAQALAAEQLRLNHSVLIDAVNPVEAPRAAWRKLAAISRGFEDHRMHLRRPGYPPPPYRCPYPQYRWDGRDRLGQGRTTARRI